MDLGGRPIAEWYKVTGGDPMMVGAATVFVVTDIAKSTEQMRGLRLIRPFNEGNPLFSKYNANYSWRKCAHFFEVII